MRNWRNQTKADQAWCNRTASVRPSAKSGTPHCQGTAVGWPAVEDCTEARRHPEPREVTPGSDEAPASASPRRPLLRRGDHQDDRELRSLSAPTVTNSQFAVLQAQWGGTNVVFILGFVPAA